MMWTPEARNAYYNAVTEELEVYCGTVEQRCEHLEATVNSATGLLRVVINDFESPYLKPILGAIVERLNSIAAFLELGLDSPANRDFGQSPFRWIVTQGKEGQSLAASTRFNLPTAAYEIVPSELSQRLIEPSDGVI